MKSPPHKDVACAEKGRCSHCIKRAYRGAQATLTMCHSPGGLPGRRVLSLGTGGFESHMRVGWFHLRALRKNLSQASCPLVCSLGFSREEGPTECVWGERERERDLF